MKITKKICLFIVAVVSILAFGCVSYGAEQIEAKYNSVKVKFGFYDWVDYQIAENRSFSPAKTYEGEYGGTQEINGLEEGKTYYVRWKEEGADTYSAPLEVVTVPRFKSGSYGEQIACAKGKATIKWPVANGATGYELYVNNVKKFEVKGNTAVINVYEEIAVNVSPIKKAKTTSFVARNYDPYEYIYIGGIKPVPAKGSKVKYWSSDSRGLDVVWDKMNGVDGYEFEYSLYNGKGRAVVDCKVNNYSILSSRVDFYRVRLRAYIVFNQKKFVGEWSPYSYVCKDVSGCGLKAKTSVSGEKAKFKLYWKKVKGAKKYIVYMAKSKGAGYKKIKTTKKTSLKVTKFKKRKLDPYVFYYFKVVAVGKFGRVTVKSPSNSSYYDIAIRR